MKPKRYWQAGWYPAATNLRAITQKTECLCYGNKPFIRFRIRPETWDSFQTFFAALRDAKQSELPESDWRVGDWLQYTDALPENFFASDVTLTDAEIALREKLMTYPGVSSSHFRMRYSEGYSYWQALQEVLFMDDYSLEEVFCARENVGVLTYLPNGFPFGGSWALVGLLEGFGHKVVYDMYNGGTPPKRLAGWNREKATQWLNRLAVQ